MQFAIMLIEISSIAPMKTVTSEPDAGESVRLFLSVPPELKRRVWSLSSKLALRPADVIRMALAQGLLVLGEEDDAA